MPTSRAFAYNPSLSAPTGATQFGNLAVQSTGWTAGCGGLQWFNGPDEDLGYAIGYPYGGPKTSGSVSQVISGTSVGFRRTATFSDATFLSSVLNLTGQSFLTASNAVTYLNSNGYWTSWVQSYNAGLFKTTYAGYFADSVSFFASATPTAYGSNPATSIQTTSISEAGTDDGSNFSCQWLGYFKPTTTQTYTFYTNSDDASYVWVGTNAISGFTTANATVNNGGAHGPTETSGSIALTAGVYYPIRIQFGEAGGGDVMTFNFSTSTITKTTNVTGLVFYNPVTNSF
jgi:hypothetical protein